jgi:hypothetical protein
MTFLETIQKLATIIGIPVVGVLIVAIYVTLVQKSQLLSEGVKELKSAYDSVVATLRTRAEAVDKRFDEEEKFRSLYLKMLTDSEEHRKMVEAWKDEEIMLVRSRMSGLQDRLRTLEGENATLLEESKSLKLRVAELEKQFKLANMR